MSSTCRVCGSNRITLWKRRNLGRDLQPEDLQITDSRYGVTLTLYKCADCSFIFADAAETSQLTEFYEQMVDSGYEAGAENRLQQMRSLLQLGTAAFPQARTLLEIGAGSGLLVAEGARLGLDAVGVEPSKSLVEFAKRTNGVQLLQGTFPHPELNGRQFDLVYLVDVIEHVADPVTLLADSARALTPGGLLVVVTPDVSSLAAKFLGRRWWHFRLAHVGYFNSGSMNEAARRAGLAIRSTSRARWFFPVRYLAERVAVYLPVGGVNRAAEKFGALRRLYDCVIPVNLHDSSIFTMTRGK
jgi:2-polyprenyl-3-methyl-5-hydroxy-6-metoxy-1,4-benzoquinol methylase